MECRDKKVLRVKRKKEKKRNLRDLDCIPITQLQRVKWTLQRHQNTAKPITKRQRETIIRCLNLEKRKEKFFSPSDLKMFLKDS